MTVIYVNTVYYLRSENVPSDFREFRVNMGVKGHQR